MNITEIKKAIDFDQIVIWKNQNFEVRKTKDGNFGIYSKAQHEFIGLLTEENYFQNQGGSDFFIDLSHWHEMNPDSFGNARFACHFLQLAGDYPTACAIAHLRGGRKFNNKQFGGGVIFAAGSAEQAQKEMLEAKAEYFETLKK